MSQEREWAIQQFTESAELVTKAGLALARVLALNPTALMIVWENADGIGATTVPYSNMLARGMVETISELAAAKWGIPDDDDDEDVE